MKNEKKTLKKYNNSYIILKPYSYYELQKLIHIIKIY